MAEWAQSGLSASPMLWLFHRRRNGTTPKKASQAVDTVLNAIAPRNSSWLLQKTFEKYHSGQAVSVTSEEDILVNRLVTLYNEANSWYTQQ